MEWLPATSTTVEPARFDIPCCAAGGIIRSDVAMRYQLGFVFHAGSVTGPFNAFTPQGTCELAMKSALACGTSAANDSRNFSLFKPRKPSPAGSMGGTGAPGTGSLISEFTDSPLSGANAAMYTRPATFGSLPASVMTTPP